MRLISKIKLGLLSLPITLAQAAHDPCNSIPGIWEGTAKISHWLIGTCIYQTSWKSEILGNTEHFILKFTANRNSGGLFCPRKGKKKLAGVCVNGMITIITKHGNLTGEITPKEGSAQGKIYLIPGVGARISIDFAKKIS